MRLRGLFLALGLMLAPPVAAQDTVAAPVLVLDIERLYATSAYADSLRAAIEVEAEALAAENERIVADLTEEERSLTERRPSMDVTAFRQEAAEFDTKVNDIRRARDIKEAEINQALAEVRTRFLEDVRPLIGAIMVEKGAVAVIDSRSVVVVVRITDITVEAIARIDAELLDQAAQE